MEIISLDTETNRNFVNICAVNRVIECDCDVRVTRPAQSINEAKTRPIDQRELQPKKKSPPCHKRYINMNRSFFVVSLLTNPSINVFIRDSNRSFSNESSTVQ